MTYDFASCDFTKLPGRLERGFSGEIYVQPIVTLTGDPHPKFEVLTRFNVDFINNPNLTEEIFSELELTGEIINHDMDVFRRAHMALSYLKQYRPIAELPVFALNVSPKTLSSPVFADALHSIEKADPQVMHKCIVEVTERYDFDDEERAFENCKLAKSMNIQIAQDDYPLGFCAALRSPRIRPLVDIIKMEAGRNLPLRLEAGQAFNASKCTKVEERIETIEQVEDAKARRIDQGQGYFWGKPGPIAHLVIGPMLTKPASTLSFEKNF